MTPSSVFTLPARKAAHRACFLLILFLLPASTALASNEGYVGTASCGSCHAPELEAWQESHHDMAMRHATPETVIGDFDDAELTIHGITSRFFMRDGRYFVNTDGPDGSLQDFEISYTFGINPLQQYLVRFPDGRVQALGLAWDARPQSAGGQRWYHLFPDEPLRAGNSFHWTGAQQNWNYMCADCHSTNLRKNYDAETDRFDTTWAEINVGCEACHGPGANHLSWAGQDEEQRKAIADKGLVRLFDDRDGVSWPIDPVSGIASRDGGPDDKPIGRKEIESCAACHSRRGLLAEGREADPVFLDHHRPALLTEGLYHPDGQILEEVFVWGSYTQSKMHMAGVTCSDCHDPHSQQLKAPGDNVCAQCHLPTVFASTDHHGHEPESAGADCLACHMPAQVYMGVDDRRDHRMGIPRPDLAAAMGAPDACSQCHMDGNSTQDQAWAVNAFERLYPDAKKPFQHWGTAFNQARQGLPQAEVSLLSVYGKAGTPPIARATAILELQNFLSPLSGQVVEQALRDSSPLVRMAALQTLERIPPANRYPLAGHLLNDPVLAVRSEAARTLVGTPLNQLDVQARGALQRSMRDYFDIQTLNADRPESAFNLANMSAQAGNASQAERYYRESIQRDATFTPAYLNLAELYRNENMNREATAMLRQGLAAGTQDPAALHHALGLAMVRQGATAQALPELRRAAELAPEVPRYPYVLGIALNSTGQSDAAVSVLEKAQQQHPNDRELMFALATMERDRGRQAEARRWTEAILSLNPADEQGKRLLEELQSP